MENNSQKLAFTNYEADAYFERNRDHLRTYSVAEDNAINLIKEYQLTPKNLLEVGCSAGYRLDGIKKMFPTCNVHGLEPSGKAIEYGRKHYGGVEFMQGTADNLSGYKDASMDMVIVGFFFYVVDRTIVLKVLSEVDRVLENGGMVIIIDFFAETSLKNKYAHIKNFEAFSFKQNYYEMFTATKLYHLMDLASYNHHSRKPEASGLYSEKFCVSLLRKDIHASYR